MRSLRNAVLCNVPWSLPLSPMMDVGPLRIMNDEEFKISGKQQFPELILNGCLLAFFVPDNTHVKKCRKSCSLTKAAVSESSRHLLPFYLNYFVTKRLEKFSLNTEFSRQIICTFTMHTRFGKSS